MANAKYDQFTDLLMQAKLNWIANQIVGVLVTGATFETADKKLADVGVAVKMAPIQQRWIAPGGKCMGLPAVFQAVPAGTYQLVVCQMLGPTNFNVLAWYDTNTGGDTMTLESQGSLIVRPGQLPDPPVGTPADSRLWIST